MVRIISLTYGKKTTPTPEISGGVRYIYAFLSRNLIVRFLYLLQCLFDNRAWTA